MINNNSNDNLTATITICTDGSMNGIITFDHMDGHILIEEQHAQRQYCHHMNVIDDNVQTLLYSSCEHRIQFIGNFNQQQQQRQRLKRSYSSERTIEMSIVTDLSMYLYHENSLRNYVFTLIAMVSHLFKHSSIGNEINIKLVKLTSLIDEQQEKNWYGSAHKTLRHFCRWQFEHNHPADDNPLHYDTAILLTKIDLCSKNDYNSNHHNNEMDNHDHHHYYYDWQNRRTMTKKPRSSCDTLGLAHSGQICDPETSCAIVEDNGLSAAFTIAHELGHLLGVPHDDEEQCKRFYAQTNADHQVANKRAEFNVMVRMIDSNSHMWSWSSCSKHFITEFLDSGHGDCLLDNNSVDIRQSSTDDSRVYETFRRRSFIDVKYSKLPAGALYNADEQCRFVFDRNSSICLDMPYCRKLWCTSNTVGGCRTQHMPWADGTECGNGYWCQEGKCVRIDHAALHPIDGDWGDWSPWSECSLNCGGGIRRSRRDCTNPSPRYGGKFCIGERVRYESCNLEPCQHQSHNEDSRAQQCAEYNRYNITWTPKYDGMPSSDVCALYCESNSGESHKLKSRVIDGTPCSPESFDICVNGKCLMAGCDRILGSNLRIDYCGVCGGNNSTCREINGQFKPRTVQHGYTFVLSIPPGATNVEIVKEPSSTSADNWLALRGEYDNYLLNGHFTVNVYERKWYYGGTTVEYSGTKSHGYERIKITRAIHNPLHLEILCVGELHIPIINYHFAVTSDNDFISYKWMIDPYWSTCSKACNGEQERKSFCVATMRSSWLMDNSQPQINEIKVIDDYCDQQSLPSTEYRVCNVHCELEWHIHQLGQCSSKCGHGFLQRQINCTQTFINHNERIYIDDFYCHHLGPKPADVQNCTGNDCIITYQWQYSEWSQCTILQQQHQHHTCGQGQQNRIAHCISTTYLDNDPTNVIHTNVGQELCQQHLSEPIILVQSCQIECPHWRVDQWSECKGSCTANDNNGERHRKVDCMHGEQKVADAYCRILEPKPSERTSCELIDCRVSEKKMTDLYHQLDNRTNEAKAYHFTSGFIDKESMINHNEIYGYHQSRHHNIAASSSSSSWQSGEWSSCDILTQYVKEYHNRFTENFQLPNCFDSIEQVNILRERFIPLFHLNNSLYSHAYTDLAHLLGLDEAKLKRRRYVACVNTKNQQVMTDNDCDENLKPKSEEYCPIEQSLLRLMPEFNVHLCPSSSTTTTMNPYQQQQQQPRYIEKMEWHTSEWSACFCDPNRRRYIRKRSVYCIRLADGNNIRDEYCHHNQPLLMKPNEIEECTTMMMMMTAAVNECDPYSRQMLQEQTEIDQSNYSTINYRYHDDDIRSTSTTSIKPSMITTSTTEPPQMSSSIFDSFKTTSSNVQHSHHHHQQTPILPVAKTTLQEQQQQQQHYSNSFDHHSTKSESILHSSTIDRQNSIIQMSTTTTSSLSIIDDDGWTEWYDWSECSVKCGNGVQTREPKCSIIESNQSSSSCDERQRPQRQYRSCYRMCDLFQWHYSDWSPCQAECGQNGIRTRTAECHDWTGTRVSDHFCENLDQHQSTSIILKEQCHRMDCNKLVWRTGQWSECTKSCGFGEQLRTVTCHRINKFGIIDPRPLDHQHYHHNLNSILRRKRQRFRTRQQQQFYNSSNRNSNKQRKRTKNRLRRRQRRLNRNQNYYYSYQMHNNNSDYDDDYWCDPNDKPSESQTCNLGPCLQQSSSILSDAFVWRTGEWQFCSSPCGFGYQRRKVYCYSQRMKTRVDRSHCDVRSKPEKRRQCNLRSCEVISCQDRRDRARINNDGIYELWIQGTMIRVYCYGMNFLEKPLEYLILNENTYDDNYSESSNIYGSSDCSRYQQQQRRKSSIHFKYVRFDALSMQIFVNDTRFSMTDSNNFDTQPIGYGQAFIHGCPLNGHHHNSITNCYFSNPEQNPYHPNTNLVQSMFSINLQKTGLIIDDDIDQWIIDDGNNDLLEKNVQISPNGEKIIGYCSFKTEKLPMQITNIPPSLNCRIGCRPINDIIRMRIP